MVVLGRVFWIMKEVGFLQQSPDFREPVVMLSQEREKHKEKWASSRDATKGDCAQVENTKIFYI